MDTDSRTPTLDRVASPADLKALNDGDLARFIDAETGAEIEPVVIDAVTGTRLGTRAVRLSD